VQEAVSTGNSKLIKLILTYRDFQRHTAKTNGIHEMLRKLKKSPDFYVEMKWQVRKKFNLLENIYKFIFTFLLYFSLLAGYRSCLTLVQVMSIKFIKMEVTYE